MIGTDLPRGTELVCISAMPTDWQCPLIEGQIYTLRGYSVSYSGYIAVLIEEVRAPQDGTASLYWRGQERGFWRWRFRKLIIPPIFYEMLKEETEEV